jgi:hypothetical protein
MAADKKIIYYHHFSALPHNTVSHQEGPSKQIGLELSVIRQLLVYAGDDNLLGEIVKIIKNTGASLRTSNAVSRSEIKCRGNLSSSSCLVTGLQYRTINVGDKYFKNIVKLKYLGEIATNQNCID